MYGTNSLLRYGVAFSLCFSVLQREIWYSFKSWPWILIRKNCHVSILANIALSYTQQNMTAKNFILSKIGPKTRNHYMTGALCTSLKGLFLRSFPYWFISQQNFVWRIFINEILHWVTFKYLHLLALYTLS